MNGRRKRALGALAFGLIGLFMIASFITTTDAFAQHIYQAGEASTENAVYREGRSDSAEQAAAGNITNTNHAARANMFNAEQSTSDDLGQ